MKKICKDCRIRYEVSELFKLHGILFPTVSDEGGNEGGKLRVAFHEPAAEGDAVGLVVETLRVQLVEVVELRVL